jgi:hypothetical protein
MKVNSNRLICAQNRPIIRQLLPELPCLVEMGLGPEGVMQHRVNSLVSMVAVSLLAAAMSLCATGLASAAEGCLEKPTREVKPGHWYYTTDRLHHRQCWLFQPSEATSTDRTPASNANSEEPLFSRFATGIAQGISSEPKHNSMLSPSAETSQKNISSFSSEPPQNGSVTKTASPKRSMIRKIVRQDQPQLAPPPTTTGLVSAARGDQLPPQTAAEKDDKQAQQLTDAERQLLFEEFLKWYRDRGIFGQP